MRKKSRLWIITLSVKFGIFKYVKSLKVFGLGWLFFASLAAVYMNHYVADIRTFYLYSMLDALILFPLVGVANGLLYPLLFGRGEVKVM